MNSINLTYDDLWSYYKQAGKEVQQEILKQLDLESFLPRVSDKVREEVLRMAPSEIKASTKKVIPLTREYEDYRKNLILMFGGKRK